MMMQLSGTDVSVDDGTPSPRTGSRNATASRGTRGKLRPGLTGGLLSPSGAVPTLFDDPVDKLVGWIDADLPEGSGSVDSVVYGFEGEEA